MRNFTRAVVAAPVLTAVLAGGCQRQPESATPSAPASGSMSQQFEADLALFQGLKSHEDVAAAIGRPGLPGNSPIGFGPDHDRFVVRETSAVRGLATLFRATPVSTWRGYLTFHYLNSQSDIMPAAFDEASFAFNGKVMGGRAEQRERWKRAVNDINGPYGVGPIGDAVGPDVREQLVTSGFHSPGIYRVNGVVRNTDAWYEAFSVTPENKLYLKPEDRMRIW